MAEAAPQAAPGGKRADDWALEELRWHWGEAYEINFDTARGWCARRRDGLGGDITTCCPDRLRAAIGADYGAMRVPRDYPPPDDRP
jgi:hypothetical protein